MKRGLSYDDVCMIPKYNNVLSRTEPELDATLARGVRMRIPIVAANMDTVIGKDLASVLYDHGSMPIFHRFYKDHMELVKLVQMYADVCFMSMGVNDVDEVINLIRTYELKPIGIVIDIAHGHAMSVQKAIGLIKKEMPELAIIAGNVCTGRATLDLIHAGADAIKVGIGPGSACTTRDITAFGAPQFTALQECIEVSQSFDIPVIADGGIKSSRECLLALGVGASSVMIGGLFAKTKESAGKGIYRGQASADFQIDYFGGVKEGTVPEGTTISYDKEKQPSANAVIAELLGGIRSGLTYGGAKNIVEFSRKAEFMEITPAYWKK